MPSDRFWCTTRQLLRKRSHVFCGSVVLIYPPGDAPNHSQVPFANHHPAASHPAYAAALAAASTVELRVGTTVHTVIVVHTVVVVCTMVAGCMCWPRDALACAADEFVAFIEAEYVLACLECREERLGLGAPTYRIAWRSPSVFKQ